jgi:hemolysin III
MQASALTDPRDLIPRLRGRLHQHAVWVSAAAAGVLVALAPTERARLAALIYGAGLCVLFGASALYHRWPGPPHWKPILRRIDHSAIFVFIAASYTPVGLLVLEPRTGTVILAAAWIAAAVGVTLSVCWIEAPRWTHALCYVATGWIALAALPQLLDRAGVTPFVLFAVGGAIYSLGALVYAARKPDPWPRVFGFHEVFHAMVIAAALVHFVAMAGWVIPGAAGS